MFCPNVQLLYSTHDASFVQCCLAACASASTAVTCYYEDPTLIDKCGFDITCLSAYTSTYITITGVGAAYQCQDYATTTTNIITSLYNKYCSVTTPTLLQVIQQAAPAVVATVGVVAAVMALAQPPSGGSSGSSGSSSSNPSPGVNFINILQAAFSYKSSL